MVKRGRPPITNKKPEDVRIKNTISLEKKYWNWINKFDVSKREVLIILIENYEKNNRD